MIYVISMEFLSLSRGRSPRETSLAAKSEEKRMFSQATSFFSSWYFLGHVWDLGPLSQHHCIKDMLHAHEDFSIPERSPRNKRNRRKICRNVQFAESMRKL